MSCCSGSNQVNINNLADFSSTDQAIHKLANLILSTPEFKEFTRLSEAINSDPEVNKLTRQIRFGGNAYGQFSGESQTVDELRIKLEAIPVMEEYRRAEKQVRELFKSLDQTISDSLGLNFAANAKMSGCG